MRFTLVDRLLEIEPGKHVKAIKTLSLAEEYLADHFPDAPVIPGVLMLEGLVEASAWLIRQSHQFQHSMVLLKEARSVKYANFVDPGQTMVITAEITAEDDRTTKLKAHATIDGAVCVNARLVLERYNLRDTDPSLADKDAYILDRMSHLFRLLYRPNVSPATGGPAVAAG